MLTQFRHHYPQGSLISELIDIDRGLYLVKVSIENKGIILATGLAGADTIELAEDRARERAIAVLGLESPRQENWETKKLEDKKVSQVVTTNSPQPILDTIPEPVASVVASGNNKSSFTTDVATEVVTQPETPQPSPETPEYQKNIFDQPIIEDTPSVEPISSSDTEPISSPPEQLDFNEIRHKIDLEMKRLKWTKEQGRDYLLSTYGKRSRLHLLDDELLEFLHYLENLDG